MREKYIFDLSIFLFKIYNYDLAKVGILLLGNSGVGKSTLGNVICDKNCFKTGYSATSVTKQINVQQTPYKVKKKKKREEESKKEKKK